MDSTHASSTSNTAFINHNTQPRYGARSTQAANAPATFEFLYVMNGVQREHSLPLCWHPRLAPTLCHCSGAGSSSKRGG